MGHSSYSFTADTYAHLLAGAGKKAAEAADALIPRKPSDQSVTSSESETKTTPSDDDPEGPLSCEDGRAPSGTRTPNPLNMDAPFARPWRWRWYFGTFGAFLGSAVLAVAHMFGRFRD